MSAQTTELNTDLQHSSLCLLTDPCPQLAGHTLVEATGRCTSCGRSCICDRLEAQRDIEREHAGARMREVGVSWEFSLDDGYAYSLTHANGTHESGGRPSTVVKLIDQKSALTAVQGP